MSTLCTWIVRVAEDSTEPMIWPWITCSKTTRRTSHLSRWLLPLCDRVLIVFLRCLINSLPRFWTQFSGGKLHSVPPCINSSAQANWLNRGDVRKALHIPDTLPPWDICRHAHRECCESADVTRRTADDPLCLLCSDIVGSRYTILYETMKEVYLKLLSLGLRALVYNGDTDMACNFLGDQWFVEDLGLQVIKKKKKRNTMVARFLLSVFPFLKNTKNQTSFLNVFFFSQRTSKYLSWIHNKQVAGFYQHFGNLTFLTVKVTTSVYFSDSHRNNTFF